MADQDCGTTDVPSVEEIDVEALRERYRQERDRRLRPDGQHQYLKTEGQFAGIYEVDPHQPILPREPISEDLDVAVLGAGFSGISAAVDLRNAEVSFRNIDHAGGFGGVWYWNRYPGLQCDQDSLAYLPLLEETDYVPPRHFADGIDILRHAERIASQYDLYDKALFHTLITALRWDESISRWRILTNRGDDLRARFVIMCGGPLNRPKLPGIPGIETFRGKLFHTARWDYDYTGGSYEDPVLDRLADKKVAIVGTGASGIQAIPYLGRYAGQLYVLHRTPSTVDDRPNPEVDADYIRAQGPGWQKRRRMELQHAILEWLAPGEADTICDLWTEISRNLQKELGECWPLPIEEFVEKRELMDFRVVERLRRRIDAIVQDKKTAEVLKPWFSLACKRPCSNNDYYDTFNRPSVKLIDVSPTMGVERMTERGFVHEGIEYEIDCLICASGFEVTSDLDRRWGIGTIEGRDGVSLYDHWADGFRTLHGAMTHGFPNMLFTGFIQGGFTASITWLFSRQAFHAAYIISEALKRGVTTVEPSEEAQAEWVRTIRETAIDVSKYLNECTPTYQNNDGDQKKKNWFLGESYGPGWVAFETLLQDWRDQGEMEGMILSR